jgi:hypothetical protein
MTDQKAAEGPQEGLEGGPAGIAPSEPFTGAQASADSLGLREVIAGAIWDTPSTHPDAIADAVYTRLKPHLAPHYQHAVDAAAAAEQRAQQLATTLDDVLRHFAHKGHPGEPCLSSGWISEKTVARWRAALHKPAPAHNAGPTVAECAEADRAYWTDKHAGEGQ